MDNIGIMGHSFGGATAFNAISLNKSIKAGIDMDGTLYKLEAKEPLLKYTGMTGKINGHRGASIVNQYVLDFFNKHLIKE